MSTDRIEIYASSDGSPFADGSLSYPVDGLLSAFKLVRLRREPGQRAIIWLGGGEYVQTETLVLGPDDSFTTIAALDPSNPPVVSGSVRVDNWHETKTPQGRIFIALSPSKRGRCLYVSGSRAPRPRYPRNELLRIANQEGLDPKSSFVGTLFDGADRFQYSVGAIPPLSDPTAEG